MPLVRITLREGNPPDFLQKVGNAIHEALVVHANVPVDDRFQVFHEVPARNLVADPAYGDVTRSDGFIVIEITLNAGRTIEIKRALYAGIAARLEGTAGVRPDDVLISLVEVTKENWSFGGGRMTYG